MSDDYSTDRGMQARPRIDRASHDPSQRQQDPRQNGSSRRVNGGADRGHHFSTSRDEYDFDEDEDIAEEDHASGSNSRRDAADLDDAEYQRLMEFSDSTDYYSMLGLSPSPPPTDAQIRSAYRTLSLSFHPDKQPHVLQKVAKEHYAQIQAAYDTLIDPQKRVVYDLLGKEGVEAEWGVGGAMGRGGEAQQQQVGIRAMNKDEFRAWFLAVMKRRERKVLESLVQSQVSKSNVYR